MKLILPFFLLLSIFTNTQNNYPQDYFSNPLDIPLILSGTFAELRSNHFHSGIDIKTQQRRGLKVNASAILLLLNPPLVRFVFVEKILKNLGGDGFCF